MDTRTELVRLAQAGDHSAAQSLIEQSYPTLYRLALAVLADPHEAAGAAREAGMNLLENLHAYPGPTAHTAWLYRMTLEVCRERMRRKRLFQKLPEKLRRLLHPENPTSRIPVGNPGIPERSWTLIREIYALDDDLRLVAILHYSQDLLPSEMAQVLNWREGSIQSRLHAARQRLTAPYSEALRSDLETGPEEGITHTQAERLIESAADFRITDDEAARLKRHLKYCPRCAQAADRLAAFENELRSALQLRWNGAAVPGQDFTSSVFNNRRRRTGIRHSMNLAGAITLTVLVVGMVMWLPSKMALQVIPAPLPPAAPAALVVQEVAAPTPTPTIQQNRAFQPTDRPGSTRQPDLQRPVENRSLITSIYPGKLAYIAFNDLSDHLYTLQPGRRTLNKLTAGFTENSHPVWSPDGSQIAYLSMPQGRGLNQVFIMNADGSANRQISRADFKIFPETPIDENDLKSIRYPFYGPPHWSADGKKVAAVMWAGPTHHYLAIMPLSDAPVHYLAGEGLERELMAWSPDGTAIAYVSQYGQELWFYEPDLPERAGQNPRKLYAKGTWDMIFGLAWSPDSGQIAVLAGLREADIVQVDMRIMRKFGAEAQNIPISTGVLTRQSPRSSFLSWSPDGRYLAFIPVFTNYDLTNGRIQMLRYGDRGIMRPLVQFDREITGLTWSPDSHWLAFSSGIEVWGVSMVAFESQDNPLVRIARSAGFSLSWQPVRN